MSEEPKVETTEEMKKRHTEENARLYAEYKMDAQKLMQQHRAEKAEKIELIAKGKGGPKSSS
jgi:hypothetical protein